MNRIAKEYDKLFPIGTSYEAVSDQLESLEKNRDVSDLRSKLCDELIRGISEGFVLFGGARYARKDPLFSILENNVVKLPEAYSFPWMVYSAYNEDEQGLNKHFDSLISTLSSPRTSFDEAFVADNLIVPLKDSIPGFWKHAQRKIKTKCKENGTHELCKLMSTYYASEEYEKDVETLTEFIGKYPEIIIPKELLAFTYGELRMWENDIALLEGIEKPMLYTFCMEQYYFDIAWAYGKIRDYSKEEEYYRKALEIKSDTANANNNLGWCLYRQKKYKDAERLFKKCIKNDWDLPYSVNNYVKTLIAEGKNKEAKEFIKNSKHNISKGIVRRVKELPNKNDDSVEAKRVSKNEVDGVVNRSNRNRNKEQFSSEKVLEDELTARIESGVKVFGRKLKIYKRKGIYGRQFITPVGRFDLLCEDTAGDIYVIELKKDSGYGDVYKQIKSYVDWVEKDERFSNKKIYGIICVNDPSNALIGKVRKDDRISLYEYQISYTEII